MGKRMARWRWPATPRPRVMRPFVRPASTYGPGHRGLDLGLDAGARVLAVEDGRVTHVGVVAGRGTVTLRHHDGLESTYEPVVAQVRTGQEVAVGEVIGRVAPSTSHCGGAACLHLGARRDRDYLDPLPLLGGDGHVRLLPLGAVGVSSGREVAPRRRPRRRRRAPVGDRPEVPRTGSRGVTATRWPRGPRRRGARAGRAGPG
ncbi:M23 family metallopeptidase [Arthrobacter sp. NEB 688]|nr:M23 family metallopeptidase [Arthrobacter sp. NEB 688]